MAKIIENVQEKILLGGKKLLLEKGYQDMTLREVAKSSNIATGTIYNYYASKDFLVAEIMWDDWKKCMENLSKDLDHIQTEMDGFKHLYMSIKAYSNIYSNAWQGHVDPFLIVRERHSVIIEQLKDYINVLFTKFSIPKQKDLDVFLSEVILHAATRENDYFDLMAPFITKLIH
jgi:AcrR family transcriptional regulator